MSDEKADSERDCASLLFDASFEGTEVGGAPRQTWHRAGTYLQESTPWRAMDEGAFDGGRCLKTEEKGTVLLQREVQTQASGPYAFSAYLKAARPGHRVRLWVRTYRQGKPFVTDEMDRTVEVGSEWARYSLTGDVPLLRNRGLLGPVDLGVESLEDGALWLDAAQFEQGEGTPFASGDPAYERLPGLRVPLYEPLEAYPDPERPGDERPGSIPLKPMHSVEGAPQGWPMIGTVTLPEGESYREEAWTLRSAGGGEMPSQRRVLARWVRDGSIKAMQVIAEGDGAEGWTVEYGSEAEQPGWTDGIEVEGGDGIRLRSPALALEVGGSGSSGPKVGPLGETCFFTETTDGRRFQSVLDGDASVRLEEEGAARTVVRMEGDHRDESGRHLFSYVARANLFRAQPLVRLEYTWINTNASPSTPVGAIGWRIPFEGRAAVRAAFAGAEGRTHEVDLGAGPASILQVDSDGLYTYEISSGAGHEERFEGKAVGEVRVAFGEEVLLVRVCEWWQNHPLGMRVDAEGMTVYFWPPQVKAVDLTRGMAKTYLVDLWFGPVEGAPDVLEGPMQLVPPPAVHCRSGLFGGEMLPQSESPFALFEDVSTSDPCLGKMAPSFLDGADVYGQFNYGDTLGDGGWCNLETQLGHAMWMEYIRTGNPQFFEIAQAAARHYRDIDMDQISGSTITHYPTHTLGGKSTSHAWIQGMLDHYMTTGERRSMEVAMYHADFLKGLSQEKLTSGGRTVTRVLDNLADLFMLTGDEGLVEKYREVCDFQRENVEVDFSSFAGLFQSPERDRPRSWILPGNFVPWYGLYSLAKMWVATGEREWADFLARETAYTTASRPFEYDRPEYFRDNPLTGDQQIVRCLAEGKIGDRGCVLFPALGYAYRATGDRRYLDIGMATVYIAMISGEYEHPLYVLAGVFLEQARQAGLGESDERRYYREAVDIMVGMAHESLANPGFEEGIRGWSAWRVKATTASYWVPIRQASLELDRTVVVEGRQSLHFKVRREMPPQGFGIPMESDDFQLEAGRACRITGWVKWEGEVEPHVSLRVQPLTAGLPPAGVAADIGPPEMNGWCRWHLEVRPEVFSLGRMAIRLDRNSQASEGDAWFDGIEVE